MRTQGFRRRRSADIAAASHLSSDMTPAQIATDNTRGILTMVAACTGFILNDTFVKLASGDIPIPQVIVLRSMIALPLVVAFCWRQGVLDNLREMSDRFLWWRTLGEIGGTATYLTALARLEIANATAIAQTTPLAVTAGAALFLGEKVGVRRWSAVAIGFFAVLLVIRPGMEGFNAWSLLTLASVGFVVLRDLASRAMPLTIHPLTVTIVSLAVLIPLGLAMSPFEPWRPVTARALLYCSGSAVTLSVAYVLIVLAMRFGEVAVVSPFRYTFLLWAIVIQIVVFAVWPDALTLIGSAILVATGLYTVYRERKVKGPADAQLTAPPATVPPPT
jgi:drug/metabolite transporter (DMT)-like permease